MVNNFNINNSQLRMNPLLGRDKQCPACHPSNAAVAGVACLWQGLDISPLRVYVHSSYVSIELFSRIYAEDNFSSMIQ